MSFENGNFGAGQTPSAELIGVINKIIVPENRSRNWLFLTNIGDYDVFLSFDKPAEVEKGLILCANGGSLVLGKDFISTGAVSGITKLGTSKVIFQEAI